MNIEAIRMWRTRTDLSVKQDEKHKIKKHEKEGKKNKGESKICWNGEVDEE